MNIAEKKVVTIEYTLKDDAGELLDSSDGKDPLTYMHGMGNLVPGLEKALEGKGSGDAVDVAVTPAQGYGEYDKDLIQKIQLRRLPEKNPQVGMRFRAQTEEGIRFLLVTAVQGDYATIDANHPLAGKTLHFAVKVKDVRDATEEELSHGHVHGEGGHHHTADDQGHEHGHDHGHDHAHGHDHDHDH